MPQTSPLPTDVALPSTAPNLRPGSVHIWCVDLDRSGLDAPAFHRLLSPGERHAGRSMVDADGRRRYRARKAFQRLVLARYLGLPPQHLLFARELQGKPAFPPALHSAGLAFSASSSGPAAALAVSRGVRVGLDIEAMRPRMHADAAADWVDRSLGGAGAGEEFFMRWTSLEARAKCSGAGLALHDFDDGLGWDVKTFLHESAGERFVVTLAARHASPRVEGPLVFEGAAARAHRAHRAQAA